MQCIFEDRQRGEQAWQELPPHEVKSLLPTQFGHPQAELDLWRLYERYMRRCRDYVIGRNRIVFMFATYVVKLPWTFDGIADNDWEGSVSNDPDEPYSDWQVQYARTRIHYEGEIPVVFMERVRPLLGKDIVARFGYEPEWVSSVDCGQVGLNRAGRLVAYDYGCR